MSQASMAGLDSCNAAGTHSWTARQLPSPGAQGFQEGTAAAHSGAGCQVSQLHHKSSKGLRCRLLCERVALRQASYLGVAPARRFGCFLLAFVVLWKDTSTPTLEN